MLSILRFLLWPITVPFKIILWPAQVLNTLVRMMFIGVCILTIIGFFGKYSWLCDISAQFRIQYVLCLIIFSVIFTGTFQWKKALLGLLFLLINLFAMWGYLPALLPQQATQATQGPALKLLHSNLLFLNHDLRRVEKLIQATQPDIISFAEYDDHWHNDLQEAHTLETYPYRLQTNDVALYSRFPLQEGRILKTPTLLTIVSDITLSDQSIRLIVAHPHNPVWPPDYWDARKEMEILASLVITAKKPCIITGDLNTTPFSYSFRHLIAQTKLVDSEITSGLQPSWPSFFIIPWLPIDHVLVSPALVVTQRNLGPYIGSDHFPVIVKIKLSKSQ